MKEYNGEEPQNARININYTGKKPKVKFSYPVNKRNSNSRFGMFSHIFFVWILIWAIGYIAIGFNEDYDSILDGTYDQSELEKFSLCVAENSELTLTNYSYVRNQLCESDFDILTSFLSLMIMFILFFLPPLLIYFPFRKKWNKLFPDVEAFLASKKYRKFSTKDVIERGNKIFVEIPVFENVICDFNATENFSKYMEEFDIREHEFYYYSKRRFRLNNKKKIKKRKRNEFIYYARWYFKQKPEKGYLEVIFK